MPESIGDALGTAGTVIQTFGDYLADGSTGPLHAGGEMLSMIGTAISGVANGMEFGDWNNASVDELAGKVIGGTAGAAGVSFAGGALIGGAAGEGTALLIGAGAAALLGSGPILTGAVVIGGLIVGSMVGEKLGGWLGEQIGSGLDYLVAHPELCPLVLDLNGNGIELTTLSGSRATFDLDNDGFREKVAWVTNGDGLLAYDANSDGFINAANELFGGSAGGFAALSAFDSNHDGLITSADTNFSQLLVWTDAGVKGLTESGELHSLSSLGITSISLASTPSSAVVAGNSIAATSTFTMGGASHTIADVLLKVDQFSSWDNVPEHHVLDTDVAYLPNLTGAGSVGDLHTVASNNAGVKAALETIIDDRNIYTTYEAFRGDVENLILKWFGVDSVSSTGRGLNVDGRHLAAIEKAMDAPYVTSTSVPSAASGALIEGLWKTLVDQYTVRLLVETAQYNHFADFYDAMKDVVADMVANPSITQATVNTEVGAAMSLIEATPTEGTLLSEFGSFYFDSNNNSVEGDGIGAFGASLLNTAMTMLFAAPDGGTSLGTYGSDLENSWRKALAVIDATSDSATAALSDKAAKILGSDLYGTNVYLAPASYARGDSGNNAVSGGSGNDFVWGLGGNDTLAGGTGSDTYLIKATDGADKIVEFGYADTDRVVFQSGLDSTNVVLTRSTTQEDDITLSFTGKSASVLLGNQFTGLGYGVEKIVFGDGVSWTNTELKAAYIQAMQTSGDDAIIGFLGSTDFTIGALAGNDTLTERGSLTDVDRIFFGAGQTSSAAHLELAPGTKDLVVTFAGHTGSETIKLQFEGNGYGVEEFHFSDGVTWTRADIENAYLSQAQTAGNDTIIGISGSTHITVNALAGDDVLIENYAPGDTDRLTFGSGYNSTDVHVGRAAGTDDLVLTFAGHTGSETVQREFSGVGNDYGYGVEEVQFGDSVVWSRATLQATYLSQAQTVGNDTIYGFQGSTNFIVNALAGDDVLIENYAPSDTDRLTFGSGYNSTDVHVGRAAGTDDLVLTFAGHTGSETVQREFSGVGNDYGYGVEEVQFGDSVVWSRATLQATYLSQAQTAGNDTVYGFQGSTNVVVNALAGDDVLIENYAPGDTDRLTFGSGYNSTDVHVGRAAGTDDLVLTFAGHTGSETVQREFSGVGYGYGVEEIQFGDSVVWSRATVETTYLSQAKTSGNDLIRGFDDANDAIAGGSGDDTLNGYDGADTLAGEAGHDQLTGGGGADVFKFVAVGDTAVGAQADVVTDFAQGSDRIDISAIDASSATAGDQAFAWIGTAAFGHVAGELRYATSGGITSVYGDVDGDGMEDFEIKVTGTYGLTASDMVL